ncbi:MAG: endo-1,4-beta-xylanase [Lachnospiraceae bacterium]|nr:endo-1,4-beta-xylanase [Lachnospiraceae bacterium]
MKRKGMIARFVAAAMAVAMLGGVYSAPGADAAAKTPKLGTTRKTVNTGASFTLKLKSNKTKIKSTKWKAAKKKIVGLTKPKKTSVKVKGKAEGKSKVTATVKYKSGKKVKTKKLTCNVTVEAKKPDISITNAPNFTAQPVNTPVQPNSDPTPVPTPTPTPKPYYYSYDYFAMFDAGKTTEKENLYVNFVLSDSWQTNTWPSSIEEVDFMLDTESAFDLDVYVAEYDCDIAASGAEKIATIKTDGTVGQKIELKDEINGNSAIKALNSLGNGRISFGFVPADGKGKFVIHDMYVNYHNNNTGKISNHKAAISVVTSSIGSATTKYNADKKAASDAKASFDKVLEDYLTELPDGLFEVRPKDASDAISNYSSMAKLTEAKGYKFGTCVTYSLIKNDPEFCKLLAHHCDSITAMNEFKAYSLLDEQATLAAYVNDETSMPKMKYEKADFICEWAKANGLKIRGHALVWDNSMEERHKWFFTKGYKQDSNDYASNEICRERLRYYVDEVMRHFQEKYPDVVYCWDVVNEGIDENSKNALKIRESRMGQNPFYYHCSEKANGQGEDYVKFTFRCAYDTREAMIREGLLSEREKIELVYNDFNVIEDGKRPYVKKLVEHLNSGDVQLCDSVGCQGYLGAYQKQQGCLEQSWVDKTTKTIKEFSSMEPSVHVQLTEMAMRNFDWDALEDHGDFAARLFNGLANINSETNNSFTSMSMWAFIDDPCFNKVDDSFDYWQYGPFSGMFDDVYRVKPAFTFAHDILSR